MSAVTSTRGSGFRRHVARGAGVVWVGASAVVLAAGIAAATFLLGWAASVGLFLLVLVSGWLWTGLRWLLEEDPGRFRLGAVGLAAPTFVVGGVGLLGMLGLGAVPVVAVLVLLHPDVRRRVRAVVASRRPARTAPTRPRTDSSRPTAPRVLAAGEVEEPGLEVTDEVTDADLCEAWRSSYVALQRARTDASRLRAVEMRAIYLDDLERRLGDDFARWMESLPRAAEDPRRFLRDQEPKG